MLGIITEATLRLLPLPEATRTVDLFPATVNGDEQQRARVCVQTKREFGFDRRNSVPVKHLNRHRRDARTRKARNARARFLHRVKRSAHGGARCASLPAAAATAKSLP
nr:glcD: glycolate oxidase, subunit [uncultured bacterium]